MRNCGVALFFGFALCALAGAQKRNVSTTTIESTTLSAAELAHIAKCEINVRCGKPGMIFPLWEPVDNISAGDRIGRAFAYFLAMWYLFLGVSIASDRFMSSIEVITSQEKEVTVKRSNGEVVTVTVRVWNETVSNLTLMALGSSAPEILLSIIEIVGNDFVAGDLGPNTIVGSAAFNLFMIIAICVWSVPSDEHRVQQHLRVFFVTATWSVFAYIWLLLIVRIITPETVDIWEGVITFIFFPITVLTAYIADRRLFPRNLLKKRYRATAKGGTLGEEYDVEMDGGTEEGKLMAQGSLSPEVAAFEQTRSEFMEIFKEMRKKHPNAPIDELQQMAEYEMLNRGPKSRAFYRVQATRKLVGGGNVIKKKLEKEHLKSTEALNEAEAIQAAYTTRVFFDPGHYTVLENIGTFDVTVTREGGPPESTILVDYHTEDGTANAGADYIESKGTLTLHPADAHKTISIEIIDDDVFEEDEHFYVHLSNLRVQTKDGVVIDPNKLGGVPLAELVTPATATVMILDDDHAGVFSFENADQTVHESDQMAHLKVMRHSGARGKVIIPYKTVEGTAKSPKDFEASEGEVIFDNDEVEKVISIQIVDDQDYEKHETFYVEIGEPIWAKKLSEERRPSFLAQLLKKDEKAEEPVLSEDEKEIAELGKPRVGEIPKITVNIRESQEFKGAVDRMVKTANISLMLSTSSWREQFVEALSVEAGDDDDDDDDEGEDKDGEEKEEKLPGISDYIMHFVCVPWKILCAFIPPTDYLGGWLCFVVSILLVGLLTAFIGDVASYLGCTIGMKDAVTAISLVALGTSVPDTFASKVAAIQDEYADGSIGNVTGSNGVNVFLGIGIAWTIAALVHYVRGTERGFHMNPGSLAYSVTIFCVEAVLCIFVIVLRRRPPINGELGGPFKYKLPTVIFMVSLWCIYIIMSALEIYCIIPGF